MKLTTEKGQLDLPIDFSINIGRNNPLLIDEGDASIPATLPASANNLEVLDHRERIDRGYRYENKVPAVLEVGPAHKHGQLVIDSVDSEEGIDAYLAIDNGDLYVQSKSKSLKEIFADLHQTFNSVEEAVAEMAHIYGGDTPGNEDYTVFPVAVAPYEDEDGNQVWQYNNEIGGKGELVYKARGVREDDILMSVPDGYGVTPFLKLHRMIDLLFDLLGYRVTENCFNNDEYKGLTLVHNCSDCLVRPVLNYADMVPSCTLSEFLDWLDAKFHVQPVVNSDSKEVEVVALDRMLEETPDADITDKMEGKPTITLSPSSRVVISPNNSLDNTNPAAETFDQLMKKHGAYMAMYEPLFTQLSGGNAPFLGGLLLRKSTGVFYEQGLRMIDGVPVLSPVGTNHFTYDRANSEETEDFSLTDVMPLMLCEEKTHRVTPFIGDRIHYHTGYKDKKEDGRQEIILVRAYSSRQTAYRTTGTTQQHIPYTGSDGVSFGYDLTTYGLYNRFWSHYNEILLNHKTKVNARLLMSVAEFLSFNTSKLKLCNGQCLLPERITAELGSRMHLADGEFVMLKKYMEMDHDEGFPSTSISSLQWTIYKYEEMTAQQLCPPGKVLVNYVFTYPYNGGIVYPGPPQHEHEERYLNVMADVRIGYEDQSGGRTEWATFKAVSVTVLLRA